MKTHSTIAIFVSGIALVVVLGTTLRAGTLEGKLAESSRENKELQAKNRTYTVAIYESQKSVQKIDTLLGAAKANGTGVYAYYNAKEAAEELPKLQNLLNTAVK